MIPKELTEENISLYNLAKEAGFDVAQWAINGGIEVVIYEEGPITEQLETFFNLAFAAGAAHEREKFCVLLRQIHDSYSLQSSPQGLTKSNTGE